jgi:hypothetical protein
MVRELTHEEYALWDALVAASPQGSIFAERWWMDVVTNGEVQLWGFFDGERLLAGMPVWQVATLGVRRLCQPVLTPYWGPIIAPADGKYTTRLGQEMAILRAFARRLVHWADVTLTLHPTLTNWMPFAWEGFSQTTRYTYRFEDLRAVDLGEETVVAGVRNTLRRARKHGLALRPMVPAGDMLRLYGMTLDRQGLRLGEAVRGVWPRLAEAALAHGRYASTGAIDDSGRLHSVVGMVWDARYAYGIFAGIDAETRHMCGGTLALWQQLRKAADVAPGYDFEGSMLEPVESFYRKFGATLTPYHMITRSVSARLNVARLIRR